MLNIRTGILIFLIFICTPTFAEETVAEGNASIGKEPKWEEYVPPKYVNPRNDFRMGSSVAELTTGIILTDLIITAPIGIPLIYHSITKIKNINYSNKKDFFEDGLKYAKTIDNQEEREKYYKSLIKKCKLSETKRQRILKNKDKRKMRSK